MDEKALTIVRDYVIKHLDKSDIMPNFDIYIVWKCKILQNWKYFISTNLYDGMYYELTYNGDNQEWYIDAYNGDNQEWYIDAYKKFENKVIKEV